MTTKNDVPQASQLTASDTALGPEDFDAIDAILDDIRTRFDETPQWEFCEGFMAALIACRRPIEAPEYLAVLLDTGDEQQPDAPFLSTEQKAQFMDLWSRRWTEIVRGLGADVQSLDDERAYHPEVMDVRGAVAALPQAEREEMDGEDLPSFAQVWAVGFMYAVESWPEEWSAPRDKEAQKLLDGALESIVALTEDDTDPPTLAVFDEGGAPSVSERRFNQFADAVWAVYDLREMWQQFGPRVETVRKAVTLGRNDLCHCGSGKKFKKCHGA
jgi:uncharacterized protein